MPAGLEPLAAAAVLATAAVTAAAEDSARPWLFKFLNIDDAFGLVWVSIGFVGQVVFAGRMFVQWIQSERRKESVVTPIFWWMSLVGSIMLIFYFTWRRDPVGVFGQFAFFIYVRNLMLIAKHKERQLRTEVAAEGSDQP